MDYFISGALLRLTQTVIYASLWIVIGCFIAAIFRRMLGAEKVKKIFGDDTHFGLLAGWLIGMLLPVCSLGVIPIVRELHRAGVKRGTIVAFGLTAPLFNPMSILYGLTLSDPIAILSFSLCALAIVSCLGFAWNRLSDDAESDQPKINVPSAGIKRSIAVFYSAGRELVGPSMGYILIGIAASVTLAVLLPKGYLQNQVNHDNVFAPVSVAFIATPIYSTPLLAMSQIGGMFQHGNSIGAAFSLLILGAGANIGLLAWFGRTYGLKQVMLFFLLLSSTTVGLAYLIDKPLYPKGIDAAGHTHAFDVYTHPFNHASSLDLYAETRRLGTEFWHDNEFGGTFLLVIMTAIGTVSWTVSKFTDIESWLTKASKSNSGLEIEIPGVVLGLVTVSSLIVASVVGCYLYYPSAQESFAGMKVSNTEAVLCSRNQKWEAADKWIRYADDQSRRLEVGVFLRKGSVGEFQSAKAKTYREKLDEVKAAVDQRDAKKAKTLSMELDNSYRQMRKAFLGD